MFGFMSLPVSRVASFQPIRPKPSQAQLHFQATVWCMVVPRRSVTLLFLLSFVHMLISCSTLEAVPQLGVGPHISSFLNFFAFICALHTQFPGTQ